MNETPQGDPSPDEVDDVYRRAAALDPSRPDESTRRSIVDHAARLAAERAAQDRPIDIKTARRTPRRVWRPAVVGTLAAALFAGLIVVPRLWTPPEPPRSEQLNETALMRKAPAPGPAPADAPAPLAGYAPAPAPAPAPPPRFSQVTPTSRAARSAAVAEPPAALTYTSPQAAALPRARQAVDAIAALRRAAQAGDIVALNRTLGQPVDVNARDGDGRTVLMLAILNGQGAAVDTLLANGADPNVADATGTTPLAAAVGRGDPSIVSALQRAGARATQ